MSVALVKNNIRSIYDRRRAAVYALCLQYAAIALNYFRDQQANGRYWTNQTNIAKDTVFSDAFIERDVIGWFMAHQVQYGVYLELANDRKHEALRPIIQRFAGRFYKDLRELY